MPVKYFKASGLLLISLLLLYLTSSAQNQQPSLLYQSVQQKQRLLLQNKSLQQVSLFQKPTALKLSKIRIADSLLEKKTILSVDKNLQATLLRNKSDLVKLEIPLTDKKFNLVLAKQELNPINKTVPKTLQKMAGNGLHYRGYIDGDPHSLAAFSVFEDGSVVGLFANNDGNFVLTRIKNSDEYIVYNDKDLKIRQPFICNTPDEIVKTKISSGNIRTAGTPSVTGTQELQCRKVKCYWEADYLTYQKCGSLAATQNFILALFNQVAAVYENDGIVIELSAYKIWDTDDPYRDTDVGSALVDFRTKWNATGSNYPGDVAYLIFGKYDYGLAVTVNALCDKSMAYGAYGMLETSVYPWQIFSWNVEATAHELGHLVGLNHTQWCGWNTGPGNTCGAIDNCAGPEWAGNDCQTCSSTFNDADPPSAWAGTIMSYCHLRPRGILMTNGFGPIPGNYMRANITNSACLEAISTCPYEACGVPLRLDSHGTSTQEYSYVTCSWQPRQEALYYTLEYKRVKDPDWTVVSPVTTTQYTITIEAGTDYQYRVKTICASSTSNYSAPYPIGFDCMPPYPVTVSDVTPTSATLSWGGSNGTVSFTLEYKKASDINWTAVSNITSYSYQLTNLDPATQYNYRIRKTCADHISTNTPDASFTTQFCMVPVITSAVVTYNTALINWGNLLWHPSYTIEYKRSDATQWSSVTTQNDATSFRIVDLEGGEDYVCRMKTKCAEGVFGDYSAEKTFTTDCGNPVTLSQNVEVTSATITWLNTGAASYIFDYKKSVENDWITNTVTDAHINLTGLQKATMYDYRVMGQCRKFNSSNYVYNFITLDDPLPLHLGNFEGTRNGNDNVLQWTTYDEVNTDRFEIEYNTGNNSYKTAGSVAAAGNGSATLKYSFVHKNIIEDAYYRLKMIDKNGTFKYSNVIFINTDETNKACLLLNDPVFPIPFTDNLSMSISSCVAQNAKVMIRSIDGRLLKSTTISLKKGIGNYKLQGLEALSAGTYTLQIIPDKGDIIARKVVKQ